MCSQSDSCSENGKRTNIVKTVQKQQGSRVTQIFRVVHKKLNKIKLTLISILNSTGKVRTLPGMVCSNLGSPQ